MKTPQSRPTPARRSALRLPLIAAALLAGAFAAGPSARAADRVKIKIAPMPGIGHFVPELAHALGYDKEEGIQFDTLNVMNWIDEDWLSADLLNNGTIDCEINWFQRVYYGIGNNQPLKAVFLIEDAPHMTVSVVNRLKDEIKSAKDFKGRNIADSAGFSTKRYLTDTIIKNAGLQITDYTPAPEEWSSKPPVLIQAIKDGKVDVVTSMEPNTSKLLSTNLLTPIYDLQDKEGTMKALGHIWLARCLFFSPKYIEAHPDNVQKVVNVFTKTLRWANSHSADEAFAKLQNSYFAPDLNNDLYADYKADKKVEVEKTYPSLPPGDYSFPAETVTKVCDIIQHTYFDESGEGKYRRAAAQSGKVKPEDTYDNRFVEKAMAAIK